MRPPKIISYINFLVYFIYQKIISLLHQKSPQRFHKVVNDDLVNYYCKLNGVFTLPKDASQLSDINLMSKTAYSHDLFRILARFPKHLRFNYLFGDVIHVPETPTLVKSRPIHGDNKNSVVLPLETHRHFYFPKDKLAYDDKLPMAVWRGAGYQPHRIAFIKAASQLPFCDIANTSDSKKRKDKKIWMSIEDQLKYKVIFSIEGNDVATNLKWIMNSNSLCFSPKLVYETWYREGQLIPNFHYVEINSDFTDIEEKFNYYMSHPKEAKMIIQHANAYAKQFSDRKLQIQLGEKVAAQYFKYSQQLD